MNYENIWKRLSGDISGYANLLPYEDLKKLAKQVDFTYLGIKSICESRHITIGDAGGLAELLSGLRELTIELEEKIRSEKFKKWVHGSSGGELYSKIYTLVEDGYDQIESVYLRTSSSPEKVGVLLRKRENKADKQK